MELSRALNTVHAQLASLQEQAVRAKGEHEIVVAGLIAQLTSLQEDKERTKVEHERVVASLIAQHAEHDQQQQHHHQQLVQQHQQQLSTLEASLTTATTAAQEKDVRLGALRVYKTQAKADLARLAELVEQGANQVAFEKEGRERGAVRLGVMQAEIQRLTEENQKLLEECETSRTRIATLMEVRQML